MLLRALLFVVHGVGEHMGRYNELIEVLIQSGILVFGHDQGKTMTHFYYGCLHHACSCSSNELL